MHKMDDINELLKMCCLIKSNNTKLIIETSNSSYLDIIVLYLTILSKNTCNLLKYFIMYLAPWEGSAHAAENF